MEMQKDEFYRQSKNPKNLHILNKIVDAAREDRRIVSVISYGSYTREDFDKFSDIEFYIFIRDDSAHTFNDEQWLRETIPVEFYFTNSYGVKTAVFSKLFVRGEFHFHSEREISVLDSWKGVVFPGRVEKTVLLDKSGAFRKKIEEFCKTRPLFDEEASFKQNYLELANGIIMEWGVLSRKDLFRAGTLHSTNLLFLSRLFSLLHKKTDHLKLLRSESTSVLPVFMVQMHISDMMKTLDITVFRSTSHRQRRLDTRNSNRDNCSSSSGQSFVSSAFL